MIKIGIDASGGDHGLAEILKAVKQFDGEQQIILYGPYDEILREMQDAGCSWGVVRVDNPRQELVQAIDDLASGTIQALVTAANSRRLMASGAKNRQEGILRPGLLAPVPTAYGIRYILDAGATAKNNNPDVFCGWAKAGRTFLQKHQGIAFPQMGLLNIAVERACPEIATIHQRLKGLPGYVDYAEPADFFAGEVDLWLMDGFTGNTILKLLEGAISCNVRQCMGAVREFPEAVSQLKALASNLLSYDAHLISPLLGLKGWVFRVHGRAKAEQIAQAFKAVGKYPIDQPI